MRASPQRLAPRPAVHRRPQVDRGKRTGAHFVLHGSLPLPGLDYNLPLTPAGVWHFYDGRAGMEPRINELREDFALRKIPTRAFAANAIYLEVVRLAYNLVTAFQRTCLEEEWRDLTMSKLRYKLFWLPGELTRPQNRPTLRLPDMPEIQERAEKILHQVHRQKPLAD